MSEMLRAEPPKHLAAIHADLYGVVPMLEVEREKLEIVILLTTRDCPYRPMNAALSIKDAKTLHKFLAECFMDIAAKSPEELTDAG